MVRTQCHITFLSSCLKHGIIPMFIALYFVNIPRFEHNEHQAALQRKIQSTKMETLRSTISESRGKLASLQREAGYEYLNITRRGEKAEVSRFLELTSAAATTEADMTYRRHAKKWTKLCETPFPSCCPPYLFVPDLSFPYDFVDGFWLKGERPSLTADASCKTNHQFTNDSKLILPDYVVNLLEKGPKFRAPHVLNDNFSEGIKLQLETLSYKIRWSEKLKHKSVNEAHQIPFKRNTVNLPPPMKPDLEQQLAALKREVMKVTEEEIKKVKKNSKYKDFRNNVTKTKRFLKENNLVAVPSDKTNRIVLTEEKDFHNGLLCILNDPDTYKKVKSKQTKIENQANKIIKSVCKNLPKNQLQKLLSSGSRPANFQAFIKDHKSKSDENFPLRPIASVRNTAIEKVDWLVSKILTQLVKYVPANVNNSKEVIEKLRTVNTLDLSPDKMFFSLDVVKLYPSINIAFGIDKVVGFAEQHWQNIDNWLMNVDDLRKCLTFICYNYEISAENETYLQTRGCPMGAHFAPAFAIITMSEIETAALKALEKDESFVPDIYVRYIDDILLGPVARSSNIPQTVLKKFNSMNENIKFTLELPEKNKALNFLDISIEIRENTIDHFWFQKPSHSQNSLRADSFIPNHVKTNFVSNYVKNVESKCSNNERKDAARLQLAQKLKKNGYSKIKTNKKTSHKKKEHNATTFTLDFISDRCNRKINKILEKYDFKIRVASKPAKYLKHCIGGGKSVKKHENCEICSKLPDHYRCDDKYLVYKFTCTLCNEFYIGETCRPIKFRYSEHQRSINKKNKTSALAEHLTNKHGEVKATIQDFDLNIIKKCANPLATRLSEAAAIDRYRPSLNRKHELV